MNEFHVWVIEFEYRDCLESDNTNESERGCDSSNGDESEPSYESSNGDVGQKSDGEREKDTLATTMYGRRLLYHSSIAANR